MIQGNPTWNQRAAAMNAQSHPLYTFEIPDEGLIITSFIPSEANVTMDVDNLASQPLWNAAAIRAAALKNVFLPPTSGSILTGQDGQAIVIPPQVSVERFNFGASMTGITACLGWNGTEYPPGMQDIKKAVSLDLVLVSSLVFGPRY